MVGIEQRMTHAYVWNVAYGTMTVVAETSLLVGVVSFFCVTILGIRTLPSMGPTLS